MSGAKFKCEKYDAQKKCLVIKPNWIVTVKGQLFWNRTWDYNNDKVPIAAKKEYLPGAKVQLLLRNKGETKWKLHQTVLLTDDEDTPLNGTHVKAGKFTFKKVPESDELTIAIHLEYKDGKIVCVKGKTFQVNNNPIKKKDFDIRTGKTVWYTFTLDPAKVFVKKKNVDIGEVEIKNYPGSDTSANIPKTDFVHLCDAYKSVWFGYKRIAELTGKKLDVCQINYPEDHTVTVSNAGLQLNICKQDLLDRDVLLHEYGHFTDRKILGNTPFYGYSYEGAKGQPGSHTPVSFEHYETSWGEAFATFISCAIQDDEHYHDGYDASLDLHLNNTNKQGGAHTEGSIQQALWRIYKTHGINFKTGFWKAYSDKSKHTCTTIYEFFNNWKDLGLADINKVVEAFTKLNMKFGYAYLSGTNKYTAVKDLIEALFSSFNSVKKEFGHLSELHENLGRTGKVSEYKEEFFNRNKYFTGGAMGAGSSYTDPKLIVGNKYIIPKIFEVKP